MVAVQQHPECSQSNDRDMGFNIILSAHSQMTEAWWLQFNNILSGNWLSFCAGRNTIDAMEADDFPATMFIHNGALPCCSINPKP